LNAIDIDVGGTFTDLVLNFDNKTTYRKAPTTPHDLSTCFINVIDEAAQELNLDIEKLLPEIEIVRYSTTVAMNRLIERKGPKLGLIATEGHEDAILIGKGAQWVDGLRPTEKRNVAVQNKPEPLISREMIVGAKERIDLNGKIIRPLNEDDVRQKANYLIDKGAKGLVVSLLWSPVNPVHEIRIREIIREEYKAYYLGYLPIILAHEVVGRMGEYQRTITAILDAYLQKGMQIELSAMWDKLRDYGYRGPFMMVHNSGGMSEVFKTDAVRTYNAGPVSGLMGGYHIASELGYKNVITADVGGTSFDIGLVVDKSVRSYDYEPIIDRWMVGITMIETLSIGGGGGSIAWINEVAGDVLEVGPKSAGSNPGPACYNMGGNDPTVTDADLLLGYINPDYYFGGRMVLSKDLAEEAIRNKIADPLGMEVIECAYLIRQIVGSSMAAAIRKEIHLRGYDPKDFVLFAVGGAGPTHVASFKEDVENAVIFPSSPVFCAEGSSVMDIIHLYEFSQRMIFMEPVTKKIVVDYEQFNNIVNSLIDTATKELRGEGLPVDKIVFSLELEMLYGGQAQNKRALSPRLLIESEEDAEAVYQEFEKEFSAAFSPVIVYPEGGVYIDAFVLKASIVTPKLKLQKYALEGEDPTAARKGSRDMYWGESGFVESDVFDYALFQAGNTIEGPAVVEAEFTTIVVPPSMKLHLDKFKLAVLTAK
jgi:N-methylhydantoinase A/acetophenone carboxylase